MDADSRLDSLARWAAAQRLADVPAAAREAARRCIADTVAVGHAGARLEVTARVHEWARSHCRVGRAHLFTGGEMLSAPGAALVNATACHALDFDDTCYDGIVHASAVVLPAALAACESVHGDGRLLVLAYCVGCQVEIELGRLLTNRLYDRGWFNTAVLGAVGAAAAAAKALDLEPGAFRDALALAFTEAAGIRAVLGSEAKPYLAGRAAEAGVRAALMARDGLGAPARVLGGPNGFIGTHLGSQEPVSSTDGFGRWGLIDPGFALKLYPVCSAAQAAAEELQALRRERALTATLVRRIGVAGSNLVVRSLRHPMPTTLQEAQFSMPFALACILRWGELCPAQLDSAVLADPVQRELMARITLVEDPALEGRREGGAECPEPARLRVELASGEVIERTRLASSGMPHRPFSGAQARSKFEGCMRHAGVPAACADALFDGLAGLDRLSSLEPLFAPDRH
jgi:2-methylcitrate dehydratase PrpD